MAKPVDRVQLSKQESAAGGGDAADSDDFLHSPLEPNEDAPEVQGFFLQPPVPSVVRDELVYVTRDGSGNMIFRDQVDATERTLSSLLVGGGGLTENSHKVLDQLVHEIAENAFEEITRSGNQVTDVIVWTDSGKTVKIRETNITRASGQVSVVVVKQYDGAGALLETLTGTIARSSGKVASIDWVLS